MHIGDVVAYKGTRWLVTGTKPGLLCALRAWDGTEAEVPALADKDPTSGVQVLAEPGKWPFLTTAMRTKDGPIVRITMVRNGRAQELEPLVEWSSSMDRPGGPVYFNPSLRLQRGEILVASHKSGKMTRLMVNASFGSVKLRQQRVAKANEPPPRRTVYDRLMSDDEDL